MNWDQYFMTLVHHVSMKSKDKSTHVGAVIVGPDNEIRSTGYNWLPRGLEPIDSYHERPTKYFVTEHAERNAIYNAARMGTPLNGCTMYTLWTPCSDCIRGIIQSGIKTIVVHPDYAKRPKKNYEESTRLSREMIDSCGIDVRIYRGPILKLEGLCDGESYDPIAGEQY